MCRLIIKHITTFFNIAFFGIDLVINKNPTI